MATQIYKEAILVLTKIHMETILVETKYPPLYI